jgi:hypothetical protein
MHINKFGSLVTEKTRGSFMFSFQRALYLNGIGPRGKC